MVDVLRHRLLAKLGFFILSALTGCMLSSDASTPPSVPTEVSCEDATCADDGFSVASDGFSFANWGVTSSTDAQVTMQMMIDMFGHGAVCQGIDETECALTPRAQHLQAEWNAALHGGRCEGMATLSERMYMNLSQSQQFDANAVTTAELRRGNAVLENDITYWWATQFTDDVAEAASQSRSQSLTEIVRQLVDGLHNNAGFTLGIYDKGMGHALTPFAVMETNTGWDIAVYDNNFPGVENHVRVNSATQQWEYNPVSSSAISDSSPNNIPTIQTRWTGGRGTLELTPMSIRSSPFRCSTCDDQFDASNNDESIVLSLIPQSLNSEISLLLTDSDGHTIVSTNALSPMAPIDVGVHISKDGGMPSHTRIVLPPHRSDFQVHVMSSALTPSPPPALLTVSHPGVASVHISGNIAQPQSQQPAVTLTPIGVLTSHSMHIRSAVDVNASVATSSDLTEISLQAHHDLAITSRFNSQVTISNGNANLYSESFSMQKYASQSLVYRNQVRPAGNTYTRSRAQIIASPVQSPRTDRSPSTNANPSSDLADTPITPDDNQNSSDNLSPPNNSSPVPATGTSSTTTISNSPLPPSGSINEVAAFAATPYLLAVDTSNNAWIREGTGRSLLRINTDGVKQRFNINGTPIAATSDLQGDVWVLLAQPEQLLHIADSKLTYFSHPQLADTRSLSFNSAGDTLYVVGGRDSQSYFARVTTTGVFTFHSLSQIVEPNSLAASSDNSMWLIDNTGLRIARINATHSLQVFQRSIAMPRSLVQGSDGAMWFVNNVSGYEVGRISSKGTFSFFPKPPTITSLQTITTAPNGTMWATADGALLRISDQGNIVIYEDKHPWGQSRIISGTDGFAWFTNTAFFTLSRIRM